MTARPPSLRDGQDMNARPPGSGDGQDLIYLLYLMECFKYASNILVVSDGMYSCISEASRPT